MFKGITPRQFDRYFQCEDDCREYLFHLKWKKGYKCHRCKHTIFWRGTTRFHTRCANCDHMESVCANTLFSDMKMPLLKVFRMIFSIAVVRRSVCSSELANEFGINLKSAWLFMRKVQKAMLAGLDETSSLKVRRIIDGIILSHRLGKLNGLQKVEIGIATSRKLKGEARLVMVKCIECDTDNENFQQSDLVHGSYEDIDPDIRIWNFRVRLTGTHHHCSLKYLKGYLAEFFFKYNFRKRKHILWHRLILNFMNPKPASTS